MKRLFSTIILTALCASVIAQTKSTPEYLTSAGFSQANDSTWTIADRATVTMSGNYVKAFETTQIHNWTMTFGNGNEYGAVVKVKSGDKITFANGRLAFADGSAYCPASNDASVLFKRSILRSAIFNVSRDAMFATDIKTVNAKAETLGTYIPANGGNGYALNAYGNFKAKIEADKAEKATELEKERAINALKFDGAKERSEMEIYNDLCKKYGKSIIDGVLSGEIMVGAPFDIVKNMLSKKVTEYSSFYGGKVVSSNATTETQMFSPMIYTSNEWHIVYYVTYNKDTQKVTSYYTKRRYY